jgi:hypothetical protein
MICYNYTKLVLGRSPGNLPWWLIGQVYRNSRDIIILTITWGIELKIQWKILLTVLLLFVLGNLLVSGALADQVKQTKILPISDASTIPYPGAILAKLNNNDYKVQLSPNSVSANPTGISLVLSQQQAMEYAIADLKIHVSWFDPKSFQLSSVSLVDLGDAGKEYRFEWTKRTPTRLTVVFATVDRITGKVTNLGTSSIQFIPFNTGLATSELNNPLFFKQSS